VGCLHLGVDHEFHGDRVQHRRYGNRLVVCFGNTELVVTSTDMPNLIAGDESETADFKKSTGTRHAAARTLSAMLNDAGGIVLTAAATAGRRAPPTTQDVRT